jgi:pseudouridine-5'-phosphate glycosidase
MNNYLHIHPEVAEALKNNQPIVALESTIISHGMPYPQNVSTARDVEGIIREQGAIPATIAILNGQCCVGLNDEQLEYLGQAKDVWKVSLRDMPYVIANKLAGATTVAATMRIASMAGIKVFVTGGIGGVHRDAQQTMDISADLTEMSNTNVAIVSAGVKSILDIGLTLEYLETLGVPVITYSQKEFPSFYSRESGYTSPLSSDSVEEIAEILKVKWDLHINGSVLIANPVSKEMDIPYHEIESKIKLALN